MSRLTPPVSKLNHAVRSMSSTVAKANIVDSSRHVSIYLPRKLSDLREECGKREIGVHGTKLDLIDRLTSHDFSTLTPSPSTSRPPPTRTTPLMQGFHTTTPRPAAHDISTIDHFVFPTSFSPSEASPQYIRVPLLPDNYTPDRTLAAHAQEEIDVAVPAQEIRIVASHPEDVLPVALSEVVGNESGEIELGVLTRGFDGEGRKQEEGRKEEEGGLREFWSGLVEDVFGKGKVAGAV